MTKPKDQQPTSIESVVNDLTHKLYMGYRPPRTPDDWAYLVRWAAMRVERSQDIYDRSKASGMPDWWLEKLRRDIFERTVRYKRVERRGREESTRMYQNLLSKLKKGITQAK